MYCPEQHIFTLGRHPSRWSFSLWFQADQDTRWRFIPLRRWLNPLRYFFYFDTPWRRFLVNVDGRANLRLANFIWRWKIRLGLIPSPEAQQAQWERDHLRGGRMDS